MTRSVFLAVAVALLTAGCPRSAKDARADLRLTGIPLPFGEEGGPVLAWDFGDGTPVVTAAFVQHAFPRAGHFVVSATEKGVSRYSRPFDIAPRPGLAAVPESADSAVLVPRQGKDLGPLLDFAERATNPGLVASRLEALVLPPLVLEASAGGASVFDPDEGLGVFNLSEPDVTVGFCGVTDEAEGLKLVGARLLEQGVKVTAAGERLTYLRWPDGREAALFADRGYLYLAPLEAGFPAEPVFKAVLGAADLGLSGQEPVAALSAGLKPSALVLVSRGDGTGLFGGAIAGVNLDGDQAQLGGAVELRRELDPAPTGAVLFAHGPQGPIGGLQLAFDSVDLLEAFFGAPQNPRRLAQLARLKRRGLDLEGLAKGLTGELQLLAWFDAVSFYRNVVAGSGRPEPRGTLRLTAPARDAAKLRSALGLWFSSDEWSDRVAVAPGGWTVGTATGDVHVDVSDAGVTAESGRSLEGRADAPLAAELQARFQGAFGRGHTSAFVDVGQLLAELEQPRQIPGLDAARLVTVQGFTMAFAQQLTSVGTAFLDLEPKGKQIAVRGALTLRKKSAQ